MSVNLETENVSLDSLRLGKMSESGGAGGGGFQIQYLDKGKTFSLGVIVKNAGCPFGLQNYIEGDEKIKPDGDVQWARLKSKEGKWSLSVKETPELAAFMDAFDTKLRALATEVVGTLPKWKEKTIKSAKKSHCEEVWNDSLKEATKESSRAYGRTVKFTVYPPSEMGGGPIVREAKQTFLWTYPAANPTQRSMRELVKRRFTIKQALLTPRLYFTADKLGITWSLQQALITTEGDNTEFVLQDDPPPYVDPLANDDAAVAEMIAAAEELEDRRKRQKGGN